MNNSLAISKEGSGYGSGKGKGKGKSKGKSKGSVKRTEILMISQGEDNSPAQETPEESDA